MGKNELMFKLMFKDKFSHHVDDLPNELNGISVQMNVRGLSRGGPPLKAYARAANNRKKAIAENIEPLLCSFWAKNEDKSINLGKLALGEAQAIFGRLDEHVKAKLNQPTYNGNAPDIQETYDELNQETEKSLQAILNKAEIVVAGFGPNQSGRANIEAGGDIKAAGSIKAGNGIEAGGSIMAGRGREENQDIVEIKPNFFGVGLNLRALWRRFFS